MEQMALYVLGGNSQEDSESGSDASDRARRVDSSADLGSDDDSVNWEHQHVPEISESMSPQDDVLDEQSTIPDATELPWTVPFDLVGSLNLTATLIIFLNVASELVSEQVAYPHNIPPCFTGTQKPYIRGGPILLVKLHEDMKQYNTLGCITQIERGLSIVCDQALDLCQDLTTHGIKDDTTSDEIKSDEALRQLPADFKSRLVQKELVVEFTTRIHTLRFRFQTDVLDPFWWEPTIIYSP